MERVKKMSLTTKAIVAMIIGYIFGVIAGETIVPFFDTIGQIFVNLLFMVATPFIFCSIVMGVASMSDLKKTGRIGLKTVGLYAVTTIMAALVGLGIAGLVGPGRGFTMELQEAVVSDKAVPTIGSTLIAMVPKNIFEALTNMTLMQIIVFAVFLGVSLVLLGEKKKPVTDFFETMVSALIKMTEIVMKTVPLGVFSLMAVTGASYGPEALLSISKVLLTDYLSFFIQVFIIMGSMLLIFARVNPLTFVRRCGAVISMAMSTTSSSATLPLTIRTATEKLGVPEEVAGFTLPLGATINLNGAAINIAVCVLFSAQVFNLDFTITEMFALIFTTCITAVGVAGMPGSAIVFTLAILAQFGIPTEAYALVIAVYRLIDMGMTPVNILGDLACTTTVSQLEKVLDRSVWETGSGKDGKAA
ncbi:dicarboxylate/amino acid:cation symporter [Bacilliculturomica massiliensis]|uniref:dicarboxylate/amino acid:cation symporter n=1 Tax=Bacilliculturomica massiliensis TaxID=1917867 RepID=UPI00103089E8|nr:dicarboxylate/amino acid:cation symporter [Bacilliculturomica massiliensis]